MDCHRATGPQHHLQLGNLLQPQSFLPPPHLPQPFTTSSRHHIFMKLCTGGVCVCEGWVAVVMGGYQYGDTVRWLWRWSSGWESAVGDCRGVSLQVAVTSVIASYFPLQRKIVFIMCHAHSARQGPLESIPKSQREEALHLNSRLASNKKGEKERREEVEEEEDRREGRGVEKTEEAHH